MTPNQKELLYQLHDTFAKLSEECLNDPNFHQIIANNNDLFPMSLDELAGEWYTVAEGERK